MNSRSVVVTRKPISILKFPEIRILINETNAIAGSSATLPLLPIIMSYLLRHCMCRRQGY